MVRLLMLSLCCVVALAAAAYADDVCGSRGSADVLKIKAWTIEPVDARTNRMTETLVLDAERPVRLIDGTITYADALGDRIGTKEIDRDARINPGEEYAQTGDWGQFTFERLLKMDPDDVVVTACVKAVIYADGSKEEFGAAGDSLADELSKIIGQ